MTNKLKNQVIRSNDLDSIRETNRLVESLNQTIEEKLVPLIEKHDISLYALDGRGGIVKEVDDVKNLSVVNKDKMDLHIKNHYWAIGTLISIFVGMFMIFKYVILH